MSIFSIICIIVLPIFLAEVNCQIEDLKIIFDGDIVDSQKDKIVKIHCSTQIKPFECYMEFLRNNSTAESIRYSNGGCYDTFGKCKPGICSCSEDCTSFRWNFTTISVQTNDSFGCKMRIYNSTTNLFYKVYTIVVYNGTGFTSAKSVINLVNIVPTTVQTTRSDSKENVAVWVIVVAVVLPLVTILIIAKTILAYRKCKSVDMIDSTRISTRSSLPLQECQIRSRDVQL
ncbi:uncharacterized protein LOC143074823 [Mytilus galloprovincialis]|uniref:uncharacterized protein LOC143074823 n=1 Tax=Mytilus galloprovincialis TaxID=29158 RepID=UPI003F7C3132